MTIDILLESYTAWPAQERFDYIYTHFTDMYTILRRCEHIIETFIESHMLKSSWENYVDNYSWEHRTDSLARVKRFISNGYAVDFELETGIKVPDTILTKIKNLQMLKIDYSIFRDSMDCLAPHECGLLEDYLNGDMTLSTIAKLYCITPASAKSKMRDLKKKFKMQTLHLFQENSQSA